MKFKLHWGQGLLIALILFILFIGSFVYKAIVKPKYDHKLMSKDYYKEALNYQENIDRLNNASQLEQNVQIHQTEKGLEFVFPPNFNPQNIQGHLQLQRLSNDSLDISRNFNLDSLILLIPDNQLVKGKYFLKLNWKHDSIPYQLKQKIEY